MSATNKNHDVLIKRIGKALKQVVQLECDHNIALGSLGEVLRDCRAALSQSEPVRYVPMTDDEWDEISKKWQSDSVECMKNGQSIQPFHLYIEAAVIRRAIAQGGKLEVQE